MVIRRSIFFLLVSAVVVLPPLTAKLIWLSKTQTTTGVMSFEGMGQALDALRSTYSVFYFKHNNDTTWFNSSSNYKYKQGDIVPVRYVSSDPTDARLNTFTGIWLGTLLTGGIPLLILIVIFLNRYIVPYNADLRLERHRPYLFVQPRTK
ncbi:MAG: hypothetical protein EOP49_38135 [Sphingobacteriales bacterium]|nr:MAG: hypothetical protein EOP49_38135 [Sphingobacteriales bacterium]